MVQPVRTHPSSPLPAHKVGEQQRFSGFSKYNVVKKENEEGKKTWTTTDKRGRLVEVKEGESFKKGPTEEEKFQKELEGQMKLLLEMLKHSDPTSEEGNDPQKMYQLVQASEQTKIAIQNNKAIRELTAAVQSSKQVEARELVGKYTYVPCDQMLDVKNEAGKVISQRSARVIELAGGRGGLKYTVPSELNLAKAEIKIRNRQGAVVFEDTLPTEVGEHYYDWSGRDKNGAPLPDDVYTLEVKAIDRAGSSVSIKDLKTMARINQMILADPERGIDIHFKVLEDQIPLSDILSEDVIDRFSKDAMAEFMQASILQNLQNSSLLETMVSLNSNSLIGKTTLIPAEQTIDLVNGKAEILYKIPEKEELTVANLKIMNSDGEVVHSAPLEIAPGTHSFKWDAKKERADLADGTYKLQLEFKNKDKKPVILDKMVHKMARIDGTRMIKTDEGATPGVEAGGHKLPLSHVLNHQILSQ
jgi:flagellar hook assembly protein FlgD